MARPRGRIEVTCQNPDCSHFNKEKGKDIIKKGTNRMGHQQYYCFRCGSYFVETKGTPLYHKHLSENEIVRVCQLLVEKNGVRSIERITGHHRDTVGRLLEDLASHAEFVNNLYNCIKRNSYLHVAHAVGKWTQSTCREMLAKLTRCAAMPGASNKITIYSDLSC